MSETTTPAAPADAATSQTILANAGETLFGGTTPTPPVADATPPVPATPAAEAAPAVEAPKTEAAPAVVVPEKYEFKAPDGVELSAEAVEAFTPIAKELGLSNEQAQKLVDLQIKQQAVSREAQAAGWKAVNDGWVASAKSDKEFGGAKFSENVSQASKALDAYGTKELRTALDESGMGNHPEVIRLLYRVGKAMSEDGVATGSTGGGATTKTQAERLFPNG